MMEPMLVRGSTLADIDLALQVMMTAKRIGQWSGDATDIVRSILRKTLVTGQIAAGTDTVTTTSESVDGYAALGHAHLIGTNAQRRGQGHPKGGLDTTIQVKSG